jgi:DNA-binding NtrC family response regulator
MEPETRRLLIIDDEQSIRFSMNEYFTHHGFRVDTASGLEQAERFIASTEYEVIIQDLRLGTSKTKDGLEIIKLAHRRNPNTRIIVLTAYGSSEVEAEAKMSGADAFLRKPQPLSQVAQVVRGLIESPRSRGARA